MPADYTNLPAHIATRVAVAADAFLNDARPACDPNEADLCGVDGWVCPVCHEHEVMRWARLRQALREARDAERVTVEDGPLIDCLRFMRGEARRIEHEDRNMRQSHLSPKWVIETVEHALLAAGYTID